MNICDKKVAEFIDIIIQFDNVEDILDACNTQSLKGWCYERLWDLVIKFGVCDVFTNAQYTHLIGNANNGELKPLQNLENYITTENIISGNTGGCSDITLYDKINEEHIFITSKYPKTDDDITKQKSVSYYDVQNIVAMAKKHDSIYENYVIYLLVPDKHPLLQKVKKSQKGSGYITDHMVIEHILDVADLQKYFLALKHTLKENNFIIDGKFILRNCNGISVNDIYINDKEML
jgi:hypothetical protein